MPRDSRRIIKVPIKRGSKKYNTEVSRKKNQSSQKILYTLDEVIDAWAARDSGDNYTGARVAKISKLTLKIESLIDRLANRNIYCKIKVCEDYFQCEFVHNKGKSETIKKAMEEYVLDQERAINQRETGIFESNTERKNRIEKEIITAEKNRIARFGNPKQQLYRTKFDPSRTFPTIIHCREYILKNSLSGIETKTLKQRMELNFDQLENRIDGSIEVRLLKTKTEPEEWVPFNENWRHLYPFNKLSNKKHNPCNEKFQCKGGCSDKNGNRVYVLQFKNENSIYSGGTNKCLYWRYHQHSICEKSNNCGKLKYRHDPKRGLRWDLMHKFYSDEYVYSCDYKIIEKWYNHNLKSCEFDDNGDGGKEFNFGDK